MIDRINTSLTHYLNPSYSSPGTKYPSTWKAMKIASYVLTGFTLPLLAGLILGGAKAYSYVVTKTPPQNRETEKTNFAATSTFSSLPLDAELIQWQQALLSTHPELTENVKTAIERIKTANNTKSHKLDLSNLSLPSLPSAIKTLKKLSILLLQENKLKELPQWIGELNGLLTLKLNKNKLTDITPEIGKLVALQQLELDYNKLRSLPDEITSLQRLTRLSAPHNQLSNLPSNLGELEKLKVLDISNNKDLTDLPSSIKDMEKLNVISKGTSIRK